MTNQPVIYIDWQHILCPWKYGPPCLGLVVFTVSICKQNIAEWCLSPLTHAFAWFLHRLMDHSITNNCRNNLFRYFSVHSKLVKPFASTCAYKYIRAYAFCASESQWNSATWEAIQLSLKFWRTYAVIWIRWSGPSYLSELTTSDKIF